MISEVFSNLINSIIPVEPKPAHRYQPHSPYTMEDLGNGGQPSPHLHTERMGLNILPEDVQEL